MTDQEGNASFNVPVTDAGDGVAMNRCAQPTAICVVRLERNSNGLLISLRLNLDIEAESGEWRQSFVDVDQAMAAIQGFVETFRRQVPAADEGSP